MPEKIIDGGEEISIATPQEVDKMLEGSDERTQDYIKKHLEKTTENPISSKEYIAKQKPLVDNIEYNYDGEIEAKKNDISLNFSYSMMCEYSPQRLLSSAYNADRHNRDSSSDNWRIIEEFCLTNNLTGEKLDLIKKMPSEVSMIFRITPPRCCSFTPEEDVCVFAENPTKPGVILSVLHEIGHSWAMKKIDSKTQKDYLKSQENLDNGIIISNEAWALILGQERDAWAFAIKAIKPFLSKDPEKGWLTYEEVDKIVHDQALQTYSNVFRNELTRDPRFEELTADIEKGVQEEI